jgi:hypothetical protein
MDTVHGRRGGNLFYRGAAVLLAYVRYRALAGVRQVTLELYIGGSDAALFHTVREQVERPDVVQLGDGTLWFFYRYRKPKVRGNVGCTYRRASVAEFPQITSELVA